MATIQVERSKVQTLLEEITQDPEWIFSAECARRGDLYLRYPPVDDESLGHLCYAGDRCDRLTRQFIRDGKQGTKRFDSFEDCCPNTVDVKGNIRSRYYGLSHTKIILEEKGTYRLMLCKRKLTDAPMKHWRPKPGGKPRYNPAHHGLFQVAGMYNDLLKEQPNGTGRRQGRYGGWRPWAQICLRTVRIIRNKGLIYQVIEG
jgi:hypothetical protein